MSVKLSSIEVYTESNEVSVELEVEGNYIEITLNASEEFIQKMYEDALAQYEEYVLDPLTYLPIK